MKQIRKKNRKLIGSKPEIKAVRSIVERTAFAVLLQNGNGCYFQPYSAERGNGAFASGLLLHLVALAA